MAAVPREEKVAVGGGSATDGLRDGQTAKALTPINHLE